MMPVRASVRSLPMFDSMGTKEPRRFEGTGGVLCDELVGGFERFDDAELFLAVGDDGDECVVLC